LFNKLVAASSIKQHLTFVERRGIGARCNLESEFSATGTEQSSSQLRAPMPWM
jgi:hypothetical protein